MLLVLGFLLIFESNALTYVRRYIILHQITPNIQVVRPSSTTKYSSKFQVAFFAIFIVGVDYLRVMLGPLPSWFCKVHLILKGSIFIILPLILTAITVLKFMFICVWKKMRVINDDLIAHAVIFCVAMLSFGLYLSKFLGPGKPVLNLTICTGVYYPSFDLMGQRFTPELPIMALAFLINLLLMILIYLKRRQNEVVDQQYEHNAHHPHMPNSLESLIWNMVIIWVCLIGAFVFEMNNRTPIEELDEFPNNLLPFYLQFIAQIQPTVFLSIHILSKHRQVLWKALMPRNSFRSDLERQSMNSIKAEDRSTALMNIFSLSGGPVLFGDLRIQSHEDDLTRHLGLEPKIIIDEEPTIDPDTKRFANKGKKSRKGRGAKNSAKMNQSMDSEG